MKRYTSNFNRTHLKPFCQSKACRCGKIWQGNTLWCLYQTIKAFGTNPGNTGGSRRQYHQWVLLCQGPTICLFYVQSQKSISSQSALQNVGQPNSKLYLILQELDSTQSLNGHILWRRDDGNILAGPQLLCLTDKNPEIINRYISFHIMQPSVFKKDSDESDTKEDCRLFLLIWPWLCCTNVA